MRLFAAVLTLWYLALSLTPQAAVPSGLGVSVAHQRGAAIADAVLDKLHPPVTMNWLADDWCMAHKECLPMVYNASILTEFAAVANDQPERLFLLISEPNCCGTEDSPAHVAQFVREWETATDNPYACCGTVQWDGFGWEAWLNDYLAAGGPVPDMWQIHIFDRWPYPPVKAFQAWMVAHDVVRPVIVSEAAAPWDDVATNMEYMTRLAQFVADGELHAVIWYSVADWHYLWPTTDLMDWDATTLTPLGEHWLSLQPGPEGAPANDPAATATPVCESCVPEEEQPPPPPAGAPGARRVWLPWAGG